MLKIIDLVYYSHNDHDKPQPVLNIHAPATGFASFIKDKIDKKVSLTENPFKDAKLLKKV